MHKACKNKLTTKTLPSLPMSLSLDQDAEGITCL